MVRVTFYPHEKTFLPEPQRFVLAEEPTPPLSLRDEAILELFRENPILPFRDIHRKLHPKISERMLRYDLAALKKKGFLILKGKGRSRVWLTIQGSKLR